MLGLIIFLLIVAMVVILLIVASVSDDTKLMKRIFLGFIVSIILMVVIGNYSCEPSSHDVKIMKPQAKAIAEDIVKNGVPTSLGDILDLPYKIQNCIRSNNGYTDKEICYFYVDKISYEIILLTSNSWSYYLHITAKTKTRVSAFFRQDSSKKWILADNEIEEYSTNHSGICSNFGRQ